MLKNRFQSTGIVPCQSRCWRCPECPFRLSLGLRGSEESTPIRDPRRLPPLFARDPPRRPTRRVP